MFAEPLVFLPARPLDAEVVRDLAVRHAKAPRLADRDAVRLDLGWPIHVVVAAGPPRLPPMAPSGGGGFGAGTQGEGLLRPLPPRAPSRVHRFTPVVPVPVPVP